MARMYYARFMLHGITAEQFAKVNASSPTEAKRLIEQQNGKVKVWRNSPTQGIGGNPPRWFKG